MLKILNALQNVFTVIFFVIMVISIIVSFA
jgi:hypothetical protein